MMDAEFDVPVVLVMFSRPDHTRAVFDRLAAIRPAQLFVIADGPRSHRPDDPRKCMESRAILERVDWKCKLHTNFSDTNLGCRGRVSSGLDWVFEQVDRAIILEDDCVPDPSFFPFCAELLERYRDDARIRTISGSNFLFGKTRAFWSYHFSTFHDIWGWATWRRSWRRIDMAMRSWPQVRDEGWLVDMVGGDRRAAKFWGFRFEETYAGRINSWAYPYLFSCWLDNSLAVTPNRNLVSNIGAGADASHTVNAAPYLNRVLDEIRFPLIHPPFMICDRVSEEETFRRRYLPERSALLRRLARRLYYALPGTGARHPVKLGRGRLFDRDVDPVAPTTRAGAAPRSNGWEPTVVTCGADVAAPAMAGRRGRHDLARRPGANQASPVSRYRDWPKRESQAEE